MPYELTPSEPSALSPCEEKRTFHWCQWAIECFFINLWYWNVPESYGLCLTGSFADIWENVLKRQATRWVLSHVAHTGCTWRQVQRSSVSRSTQQTVTMSHWSHSAHNENLQLHFLEETWKLEESGYKPAPCYPRPLVPFSQDSRDITKRWVTGLCLLHMLFLLFMPLVVHGNF